MDENEFRKELLEIERRYYDKIESTQKFYLGLMSGFLVLLGVLMTLLKLWK